MLRIFHKVKPSSTSASLIHFQICKDDLEIAFSFHKSPQEKKSSKLCEKPSNRDKKDILTGGLCLYQM